ncbi:MAG: 2-hydroxyacyl-CoA dehydratase [Oscillospiraceae bacterium]|nr:2-hydroxyacyl-CoA dehydratase [Oscillospiraceae bacterium]
MRIGVDVGSTTLKCVVLDENNKIVYKEYNRHYSMIVEKTAELLQRVSDLFPNDCEMLLSVSGSAGMGMAENAGLSFVQEVYATRTAVKRFIPSADVVIELGGEDAKILFLDGGMEVRMNGSCAGGTGAFIDQMSTLLAISPDEMNEIAKSYEKIYTIASRCGVFAKSDIQPLLNQGANKADISASIFAAVVNQTIAGLAQGREIEGTVVYLGGPLTFLSELRAAFDRQLGQAGVCPDNSLYFVAMGAALSPTAKAVRLSDAIESVGRYAAGETYKSCPRLFEDEADYEKFKARHAAAGIPIVNNPAPKEAYLGVDAGSTTLKAVVLDENGDIFHADYMPNSGNPIPLLRDFLLKFYEKYPNLKINASASTGYGEEITRNAFGLDMGLVETMAHFTAARKFNPDVDFIIDIGGQDIKCFKIRGGAIDNIFLNEACSSGCGSFLQTFAGALGYSISEFAQKGILADKPVDLGSRCTVFMNSSVKQAQKDGASIENISAGLSLSVVKNAIYKVIRAVSADSLGKNIVVQGGTFLNDAVLRAFETELGRDVIRPNIAGLMGAYGAALYAKANAPEESLTISEENLKSFTHETKQVTCNGCTNHCRLTVNSFGGGRRFIAGNRCEKPLKTKESTERYDLYEYNRELLAAYKPAEGRRGTIGIPMGLNMCELYPFWHTFFTKLGFKVIASPESDRDLYLKGQHTIPSDTVCYPAKLLHGHIESLIDKCDAIFYPCMSYNLDEGLSSNHYNCPVVAYYPEVINANVTNMGTTKFIYDYIGLHRPADFVKTAHALLRREFGEFTRGEVKKASDAAYGEYRAHMKRIADKGAEFLKIAKEKGLPVIVLCGRPYHIDAEINHGIDKLICDMGAALVTEDSISPHVSPFETQVLNQWTYHARLYAAAKWVSEQGPEVNLVQLVSFGCGVDAITTDEVRRIIEEKGKIYTQIKIDEITNMGTVKIRLRSLFAALKGVK